MKIWNNIYNKLGLLDKLYLNAMILDICVIGNRYNMSEDECLSAFISQLAEDFENIEIKTLKGEDKQ